MFSVLSSACYLPHCLARTIAQFYRTQGSLNQPQHPRGYLCQVLVCHMQSPLVYLRQRVKTVCSRYVRSSFHDHCSISKIVAHKSACLKHKERTEGHADTDRGEPFARDSLDSAARELSGDNCLPETIYYKLNYKEIYALSPAESDRLIANQSLTEMC